MPQTDSHSRVLAMLEEATQSAPGTLDEGRVLQELEGWDSMGMVMFMGLVKESMAVELSVHDLRECVTASDLAGRISAKQAG